MLELRSVTKRYSGIPVVDSVDFIILPGQVTGYLGPNGSGKSTTLKMITGLIEPSEGKIIFDGTAINCDRIRYRQRFGYVPEEPQVYPHLTGSEYLQMVCELRGLANARSSTKIHKLLRLFSLYEDRDVAMSSYSKGMRQKVLLAAALFHNPDLILLDEPFSGLDVGSALILRDLTKKLAARGKTILLSSHEMDTIERVCSRVVILSKGRVAANDSIDKLRALMCLPSLERVFSQLALEQDTESISAEIAEVVES
jgi:ABC-2 type transport system ATP-binding protein